jgi:hypothetical protein
VSLSIKIHLFLGNNPPLRRTAGPKKKKRIDFVGIIFNCIIFYLTTLPLFTFFFTYLNLDSIYFIIPAAYRNNPYVTLLRYPFNMLTVVDHVYNLISFQVVLMTLVLHTKSILSKLLFRTKHSLNSATDYTKDFTHIRSFVMLNLAYKLVSRTVKLMIMCTLLPLALVIITCTYVLIRLPGKLNWGMYFLYFAVDSVYACLLFVQLPQMADCYQLSQDFIFTLKGNCVSRKTRRYKAVRNCKAFGFRMGDIYVINNGSNNTYFESVVYYTINALITF